MTSDEFEEPESNDVSWRDGLAMGLALLQTVFLPMVIVIGVLLLLLLLLLLL